MLLRHVPAREELIDYYGKFQKRAQKSLIKNHKCLPLENRYPTKMYVPIGCFGVRTQIFSLKTKSLMIPILLDLPIRGQDIMNF